MKSRQIPRLLKTPARKRNPVPRSSVADSIEQAALSFQTFTGMNPGESVRVKIPVLPKAIAVQGQVDYIGYTTVRDGIEEHYEHKFAKHSKPLMCANIGGQLVLIGENYQFTDRGIVDNPKPPRR